VHRVFCGFGESRKDKKPVVYSKCTVQAANGTDIELYFETEMKGQSISEIWHENETGFLEMAKIFGIEKNDICYM
jgi:hypothetical protein